MKYNRFLPLLIPIIALVLSEVFFFWPRMIYVVLALTIILFWFAVRQFIRAASGDEKWWNYLILPSCFWCGLAALSVMIPSKLLVQMLFILGVFFLYFYFRVIYYYLAAHARNQKRSLENLFFHSSLLTVYFIASAIFGLQAFLNAPVWPLVIVMLFVAGMVIYQVIWANKVSIYTAFFYVLLGCLIMAELTWSISFLPLSFYIQGFVLSIYYYMLMGIIRFYLRHQLNRQIVKRYLAFGFLSILAVLLTARWR